jgi:hypothetical protein
MQDTPHHPSERPDVRENFLPKYSLNFELWELQLRPVGTTHPQFLFFNNLFHSGLQKTACLRAERLGDCWIDALTSCTFPGVLMDLLRPCIRLLSVLPDSSNCLTQKRIMFPLGTALLCGMLNRRRKVLCVMTTDRLFSKYTHTAKPRCVPVQTMYATEMGSLTEHRETMCTTLTPLPPEYSPPQTA